MSKTLVIILNHNLPEYANWLYDSLKEFQGETFDVLVMDNCSKPELTPATTHIRIEQNIYWGGALNEAFKLVLKDDNYDSLLFLNNDIEFTGDVFVNLLRHELFSHKLAIVSPCIAGRAQPWKQMQNWGSLNPRIVKWIDLVAPLFHRKFIEEIGQFDSELYYGWGQELICYDVCQEKGWKTGVCDHISIVHFGMQTLVQQKIFYEEPSENGSVEKTFTLQERHALAMNEYRTYFATHPLKHGNIDELRAYGEQYTFYRGFSENHCKGHQKQKPSALQQLLGHFKK